MQRRQIASPSRPRVSHHAPREPWVVLHACAPPRRESFGRRTTVGAQVADVCVKPPLPSKDGVPVDEWPTATEIQIYRAWCQITWL